MTIRTHKTVNIHCRLYSVFFIQYCVLNLQTVGQMTQCLKDLKVRLFRLGIEEENPTVHI
jgi:hypothetical protein